MIDWIIIIIIIIIYRFLERHKSLGYRGAERWIRFNVPPNTLSVISGTIFYKSNDPTNSVKALKEDRS